MQISERKNISRTDRRMGIAAWAGLLIILLFSSALWALDPPALKGRVNDYANMMSPHTVRQLETLLANLEQTDSTQIVVLTIPSLKGDSLEEFSMRTAEKWGIGQKGADNGAILLISKNDRKIRIEVGYGLEGKLTDLMAGRIIRDIITPQFKSGQFDQGILDGVTAMVGAVRGEFAARDIKQPARRKQTSGSPGLFGLFAILFLLQVVSRISKPLGAVAGGILAPIVGLFFGVGLLALLLLIPVGIIAGLLAGVFGAPLSFGHGAGRGGYWGGGGGFSSGGGFGGFSGGGGGFGGGGSSGGW